MRQSSDRHFPARRGRIGEWRVTRSSPSVTRTTTSGGSRELLRGAGVELLVDVRANPRSRYPQFNRSALAGTMKANGIGYALLGAELGGRREPRLDSVNTALEEGPFRGYADHMASEEFLAGVDFLEELARERRAAVMCAEGLDPLPPPTAGRHPHGKRVASFISPRMGPLPPMI